MISTDRAGLTERSMQRETGGRSVSVISRLLSVVDVAMWLNVSVRTVQREIGAGRLAVTEVRGVRRIDPLDVAEYIAAGKRRKEGDPCPSPNVAIRGTSVSKLTAGASRARLAEVLRELKR